MSRGQTASKQKPPASRPGRPGRRRPRQESAPNKGQKSEEKGMAAKALTATKAKAKEAGGRRRRRRRRRDAGQPAAAARPVRCRGQEDDQAGQEARLRHPRPAQRRAALRGGVLRPDRGHLRDAQRDGHQRGRPEEGAEDEEAKAAEEADDDDDSDGELVEAKPKALAKAEKPRSRPSAPTIRSGCICARWARWSCSPARARSPSPSASRPAARR